jgi:hypothetical protein
MKQYSVLMSIVLLFSSIGCNRSEKIEEMLKSEDKTEIIEGCSKIHGIADTIFIGLILKKPYDIRISHDFRFKGTTVHKAKVRAMERISGLAPPNPVTFSADTVNVEFYKKWARDNGYID